MEKKNLLVPSNFSFPTMLSTLAHKNCNICDSWKLLSANAFNLDKNLSSGRVNFYQSDRFLDWSKLKAFADDKIKLADILKFVLGSVESIVGKGENAGYQHFLLFPQCFQKASVIESLEVRIVW